ncbi:MAG: hypothetical protein KF784_06115 [Fimbriimonadaceae bacterium]|nr:hypothetical protein [Fimbriimonadaceae bacterium]
MKMNKQAIIRPKVDYRLRPSKSIERRMMVEAFQRLSNFGALDSYRYIGFGSIYFVDFLLFHKALAINDFISIEHKQGLRERIEFNLPLKCIKLEFKKSTDVLQSIGYEARTILWLDYEDYLNEGHLIDLSIYCKSAQSGSIIMLTFKALACKAQERRWETLRERVTDERFPQDIVVSDTYGEGIYSVNSKIIQAELDNALLERNSGQAQGTRFEAKQIFNYSYCDSVHMHTVGYVLYQGGDRSKLDSCRFADIEHINATSVPYQIDPPKLTAIELACLIREMPFDRSAKSPLTCVPIEDVESLGRLYRYLPVFVESEGI